MKDGTFMAIGPVRKNPVPFINEKGETALLYYSDVMKMAIDATGAPVEETRGVEVPDEINEPVVVPDLKVEARQPPKLPEPVKVYVVGDLEVKKVGNAYKVKDEHGFWRDPTGEELAKIGMELEEPKKIGMPKVSLPKERPGYNRQKAMNSLVTGKNYGPGN
jgi:hypothetical protein